MLLGFLKVIYFFVCILIILLVLAQKAKGSLGASTHFSGQAQSIFGSTGGQDLFQKATWVLGAMLIFGSLFLTKYASHLANSSSYIDANTVLKGNTELKDSSEEVIKEVK
jgi:preprotein translocase subunit SecG